MSQAVNNDRHRNNARAWRRGTPGAIRHHLGVISRMADEAKESARRLRSDFDEAYDAGLLSLRSNTGGGIPAKGSALDHELQSDGIAPDKGFTPARILAPLTGVQT
ncbi:MAG: hypothetical protein ACREMY_14115 [bacterium]